MSIDFVILALLIYARICCDTSQGSRHLCQLLAFGIGLPVDALETGSCLNAVSAVALPAVRKPLFTIFFLAKKISKAVSLHTNWVVKP